MTLTDKNRKDLLEWMIEAAKEVLNSSWLEVKPFAEQEFSHFTDNIKLIQELTTAGKITQEQARNQMEIQKESMRLVILCIRGVGMVAAENTLNAIIEVIKTPVNKALGWSLL